MIVTTTESGRGCLKAARIADKILWLSYNVIALRASATNDPLDFFATRLEAAPDTIEDWQIDEINDDRERLFKIGQASDEFDAIEFWIDPDPNSQLLMLQILHYIFFQKIDLKKYSLVNLTSRLGEKSPEHITAWNLVPTQMSDQMIEVAAKSWVAFGQSTPMPWLDLRNAPDLSYFPFLPFTIRRTLMELPNVHNGLTRSQSMILECVACGGKRANDVLVQNNLYRELDLLDYWSYGRLLDELSTPPHPAICGLEGHPFSLEMHDDEKRRKRYFESLLGLTEFGEALLAGTADYIETKGIDRWWGGIHLNNNNAWRWDEFNQRLINPKAA